MGSAEDLEEGSAAEGLEADSAAEGSGVAGRVVGLVEDLAVEGSAAVARGAATTAVCAQCGCVRCCSTCIALELESSRTACRLLGVKRRTICTFRLARSCSLAR